ncbi:hypothetical protein N7527_012071 [Penicillium freii]|nr:hypothetical protein N7527_012071 [Penicillium freii]
MKLVVELPITYTKQYPAEALAGSGKRLEEITPKIHWLEKLKHRTGLSPFSYLPTSSEPAVKIGLIALAASQTLDNRVYQLLQSDAAEQERAYGSSEELVNASLISFLQVEGQDGQERFTQHILTAKEYLKRMEPPPRQAPRAGIVHPKRFANSPVGKQVWWSGTGTCIGTITVTYDRCTHHRLIPYPHGFQHDLGLVTGPNHPQLTNPPHPPDNRMGSTRRGAPSYSDV